MQFTRPKALLIGENSHGSSHLAEHLQKRGYECGFAVTHKAACSLLQVEPFDLVLSAVRLPDGSAFSLVALLEDSISTLFFFEPVENSCWWLPALRNGRKCFGSSALLPSEFVSVLDEVSEEIRLRTDRERSVEESVGSGSQPSASTKPSSTGAEPKRAEVANTLRRKAAG
jgi:response regulator RpfG family c-di-GMP phosphodiesterase